MASNSYPRPGFNDGEVIEALYERLVAPQAPDGLIGAPTDQPLVYADGVGTRAVRIRAGRFALVRGFQFDSGDADITITLPANTSGASRVDLIVLRLDRSTWRVQETFIQGTAGQGAPSPVASPLFWDLPVAAVTVAHNAGTLSPTTVQPRAWYIGDDGQLRCTSTTRPPHQSGRRIWEHDTNQEMQSTGSRWIVTAANVTEVRIDSTLNNFTITTESIVQQRGVGPGGSVKLRFGSFIRSGGSSLPSSGDIRLPATVPAAARHPDRDQRCSVYLPGGRSGQVTIFSAGAGTKAGQIWLTSHPGLSVGDTILGTNVGWDIP
ncbi:hypothetical protein ABT336_13280 [Micromonospora sp. NPDC000207]|uniref:hypothetical protein n=1 Tax=Micromonospora sp. NPDC000207 TaxID=3154246 RepID=UPI0033176CAF